MAETAFNTDEAVVELWREGSFVIEGSIDETNRCGIINGSCEFRYEARFACYRRDLDGRGFLIDNRAINLYWVERWTNQRSKVFPSCELIADIALRDFLALLQAEGVACIGIEVKVYGGTYSCVTTRIGAITPTHAHPAAGATIPKPLTEALLLEDAVRANLDRVVSKSLGTELVVL